MADIPVDRKKMSINEKNGRHAVTHYRVLKRFSKYTYIECQLETGMANPSDPRSYGQHPSSALGDTVYGPEKSPFHLQGQTLHAGVLGFVHPRTGEYMEFTAPLPQYFTELLQKLENM